MSRRTSKSKSAGVAEPAVEAVPGGAVEPMVDPVGGVEVGGAVVPDAPVSSQPGEPVEDVLSSEADQPPVPQVLPAGMLPLPQAPVTHEEPLMPEGALINMSQWRGEIAGRDKKIDVQQLCWDLTCSEGQIRPLNMQKVNQYYKDILARGPPASLVDIYVKELPGMLF